MVLTQGMTWRIGWLRSATVSVLNLILTSGTPKVLRGYFAGSYTPSVSARYENEVITAATRLIGWGKVIHPSWQTVTTI
jgi:hypothetical protein